MIKDGIIRENELYRVFNSILSDSFFSKHPRGTHGCIPIYDKTVKQDNEYIVGIYKYENAKKVYALIPKFPKR